MSTIFEPARVLTWLQTTLNPLASGGAYYGIAPMSVTSPWTVYTLQSGVDLMVIGAQRVWSDGLYLIKAMGPATDSVNIFALADANDTALHNKGGVNVGVDGLMLSSTREQTVIYYEVDNDTTYLHAGGIYRIYAQQQP